MQQRIIDAMLEGVATGTREYIDQRIVALEEKLAVLVARTPDNGEKGEKGDPGEPGISGKDGRDGKDGAPGADGRDGVDGKDGEPGKDGPAGAAGADGLPGVAGADVDIEVVRLMAAEEAAKIPPASDGKDGAPGKDGLPGKDGRDGDPGRDGLSGVPGRDGKDGEPGLNGKDGLGFDDLEEELADDGRTIIRRYKCGDRIKEFRHTFPVMIYRGIWQQGREYVAGDTVTWGGQMTIAAEPTTDKPGDSKSWVLAVRRGRDGKDGVARTATTPVFKLK